MADAISSEAPPLERGPAAPVTVKQRRLPPLLLGVAVLTALTALVVASGSPDLYTYNVCLFAAIGALSLNLLMGTAGLVSIGNPAFMAVGAFMTVYFMHVGIPFPLDIVAGALVAGLAGFVIGLPAVRLRGLHLALATMAGFFIVIHFAGLYQRKSKAGGAGGFIFSPLYGSKGIEGAQTYWAWTVLAILVVVLIVMHRLSSERSGRAWRMIRDHEIVAQALGVPVFRYKMSAFIISSTLIGLQGALLAYFSGAVVTDSFTFNIAVAYVAMVLIGGLDSPAGAVLGAGLVTALPVFLPRWVEDVFGPTVAVKKGPGIAIMTYGAIVIIFITFSTQGMVGLVRRLRSGATSMLGRARR